MIPLSMISSDLWPRFQGHDIIDIEYLRNDTRQSHSYYRTSIGSNMRSARWHCNDLNGPITRFSRSRHFWSRISEKRCVLGTTLLKNTDRKPYAVYRMVPLSMTLSDHWPRFQGHIFLWSNIVKTARLKDKVTIVQLETISSIIMEWYYVCFNSACSLGCWLTLLFLAHARIYPHIVFTLLILSSM